MQFTTKKLSELEIESITVTLHSVIACAQLPTQKSHARVISHGRNTFQYECVCIQGTNVYL